MISQSSLPLTSETEEVHASKTDAPLLSNGSNADALVRQVVVTRLATEHLCLRDHSCLNTLLSTICSIRRFHSYSEVPILVYVLGTARHANRVLTTVATAKRFNVVRSVSVDKAYIMKDIIDKWKFPLALWLDAGRYAATIDLVIKITAMLVHAHVSMHAIAGYFLSRPLTPIFTRVNSHGPTLACCSIIRSVMTCLPVGCQVHFSSARTGKLPRPFSGSKIVPIGLQPCYQIGKSVR